MAVAQPAKNWSPSEFKCCCTVSQCDTAQYKPYLYQFECSMIPGLSSTHPIPKMAAARCLLTLLPIVAVANLVPLLAVSGPRLSSSLPDDVAVVPFKVGPAFAVLNATTFSGVYARTGRPFTAHVGIVENART